MRSANLLCVGEFEFACRVHVIFGEDILLQQIVKGDTGDAVDVDLNLAASSPHSKAVSTPVKQ